MPENVKVGTAVVVSSPDGEIQGVFLVHTMNISINAKDQKDLCELAAHYNQNLTFVEVGGWDSVEALKNNIKQLNGDE